MAGDTGESRICWQLPLGGMIICTSNCSAQVMLPAMRSTSGETAGTCSADKGNPLEVDPPSKSASAASCLIPGGAVFANASGLVGAFAVIGSDRMLPVLMYAARARSARMRSTADRSAASAVELRTSSLNVRVASLDRPTMPSATMSPATSAMVSSTSVNPACDARRRVTGRPP